MLSSNYNESDGISAASNEKSPETEFGKDGFTKKNRLLKVGYQVNEAFKFQTVAGINYISSDYDAGAFRDANNSYDSKTSRVGISPSYKTKNSETKLNAFYIYNTRKYDSKYPSNYSGRNLQIDLNNRYLFSENITTL